MDHPASSPPTPPSGVNSVTAPAPADPTHAASGQVASPATPDASGVSWLAWLILLGVLLPALLFGLQQRPVYKIQEVRIAETAREMLASDDYLVPRLNGQLRLQKPPLPYWNTAASYGLFGVSAMAARLPSVLFTLASACLLFTWLRAGRQWQMAASAALILVTSFIALRYGRSAEADASLMFSICAACYLGYRILQGQSGTLTVCLFYLALGLAFMCKGPAGLAIPLLTLLLAAWLERRFTALKPLLSLSGLCLLLLCAFGWYAWIAWRMPELAQQFFGKQLDETFVSGTHAQPLWWYVAHICEFFLPWGLLLVPALWWASRHRPWPPLLRYAMVWLAVVLVLLTGTVNKQVQYALLFAPPLAILLAHYLALAQGGYARLNRGLLYLFLAGLLAALGYTLYRLPQWPWQMLVLPAVLGLVLLLRSRPQARNAGFGYPVLLVAMLTALVYCYGELNMAADPDKTDAPLLMAQVPASTRLYQPHPGDGALSFYAGRVVTPLKDEQLLTLLQQQPSITLVARQAPDIPEVAAEQGVQAGGLSLWQLRLR